MGANLSGRTKSWLPQLILNCLNLPVLLRPKRRKSKAKKKQSNEQKQKTQKQNPLLNPTEMAGTIMKASSSTHRLARKGAVDASWPSTEKTIRPFSQETPQPEKGKE